MNILTDESVMAKKTIWVVDSNDNWRDLLAESLQRDAASEAIGYDLTVRTFENQAQVLAELDKAKPEELPDVITTNVLSPDFKTVGIDLIGRLRGPIGAVIVSADITTQRELERLEKQGVTSPKFISKMSFERPDFYAAVKEAIETAKERAGQPDVVVNNPAGGGRLGQKHHDAFIA